MTFQNRISFSLQVVSNQKVPWRPADPCLLLWSSLANHLRSPHRKQPLPWVCFLVAAEHFCSQALFTAPRERLQVSPIPPQYHVALLWTLHFCSCGCVIFSPGPWPDYLSVFQLHQLVLVWLAVVGGDAADGYMPCGHGHRPHTSLHWLPMALPQSCYHPLHLSSNLIRLFGQKVCISKCPTPMAALFVNPLSLLKVLPFLPCLLGVTSVPFISQYLQPEEKIILLSRLCCIPYARDASFSLLTILPFNLTKFYCLATISKSFLNHSPLYQAAFHIHLEYTPRRIQLVLSHKNFPGLKELIVYGGLPL